MFFLIQSPKAIYIDDTDNFKPPLSKFQAISAGGFGGTFLAQNRHMPLDCFSLTTETTTYQ